MDQMRIRLIPLALIATFITALIPKFLSAEIQSRRELSGTVSFVNSVFLTVIYDQDKVEGVEKEITLYKNNDIRYFNRYRWEDIRIGDQLRVVVSELSDPQERVKADGTFEMKNWVTERKIIEIYFPNDESKSLAS